MKIFLSIAALVGTCFLVEKYPTETHKICGGVRHFAISVFESLLNTKGD